MSENSTTDQTADDLWAAVYDLSHYKYRGTYYDSKADAHNHLLDTLSEDIPVLYRHLLDTDGGYRTPALDEVCRDPAVLRSELARGRDSQYLGFIALLVNTPIRSKEHPEWDEDRKRIGEDVKEVCGSLEGYYGREYGTDRLWPKSAYDLLFRRLDQFYNAHGKDYGMPAYDASDVKGWLLSSCRCLQHLNRFIDGRHPDYGDEPSDSPLYARNVPAESDSDSITWLFYTILTLYGNDAAFLDLVQPDQFVYFRAETGEDGSIDYEDHEECSTAAKLVEDSFDYPHTVRSLGYVGSGKTELFVCFTPKPYAVAHDMKKNRKIITADNTVLGTARGLIFIFGIDEYGDEAKEFTDEEAEWIRKTYGRRQYFDGSGPDPLSDKRAHEIAAQTYLTVMMSDAGEADKLSRLLWFGFTRDDIARMRVLYESKKTQMIRQH